jgi:release factor glutamine methyltransferase
LVSKSGGSARRKTPSVAGAQSVAALIDDIAARLAGAPHIDDPRREAHELLAALLDVPRHWPFLHENKWMEPSVWQRAHDAVAKRLVGAPRAYSVGRANFRNLTLDVDERVLIPRPETEQLVELVLERAPRRGIAVDVGTGSGAIAIALATEGKFARVIGTDVSVDALVVASENAVKCGARSLELRVGSLLGCVNERLAAVVSNPPYVTFGEIRDLPHSVRDWEPAIALVSEHDGLGITKRLARQAASRLEPGGLLAVEVDARRASLVAEVVSSDARYEEVTVALDLAGRERFVLARRGKHGDHS